MVGQVVNRGYQMHLGKHAEIINATVDTMMTLNGTTSNPVIKPMVTQTPLEAEGYANPVKLGYALSVTFVVGCIQVNAGIARHGAKRAHTAYAGNEGPDQHAYSCSLIRAFIVHLHTH